MTFDEAIDEFIRDKRSAGQINSDKTEFSYRSLLARHREDVANRDPRYTGRDDVKKTLRRWEHPNTQANARAIFVSFYRWSVEEGLRKDNPAEQTRRPKKRQPSVYRLKRAEVVALMRAASTERERRVIYLGLLVGARNAELRGLQLRHFTQQVGAVWISPDIAKGGRERYVPVLPELEPVVADILRTVGPAQYVIPSRRSVGGRFQTVYREAPLKQCSQQALGKLVADVARRAGLGAHIYPHLLRHAFGDHVSRQAGLRAAQAVLGHASSDTTESTYTGGVTLDELTAALAFFRYDPSDQTEQTFYPPAEHPGIPVKAPSGFEPEVATVREPDGDLEASAGGVVVNDHQEAPNAHTARRDSHQPD